MDAEIKEFLGLDGLRNNLSFKKIIKYQLKYSLYFLILLIAWLSAAIIKVKNDTMSMSYGVFKACKRCTYGKSRETIIILSGNGYSRNDKVLQIMNYKNLNYTNVSDCLGYTKCSKCLDVIDKKINDKPCKFI